MEKNPLKKLRIHKLFSLLTILLGFVLVTFMVVVEDEPGALPLALILAGTGWYFITRTKLSSQKT